LHFELLLWILQMSVNYSFNQRHASIKLQYKHDNETFGEIRDIYNSLPIAQTHPMLRGQDVKRIVTKLETTGSFLNIKTPGRPKSATDENSAASILAAINVNPHTIIRIITRVWEIIWIRPESFEGK